MNEKDYLELLSACQNGDEKKIINIVNKGNVNNFPDKPVQEPYIRNSYPPLFAAYESNNIEAFKMLLEFGADPNIPWILITNDKKIGIVHLLRYVISSSIDFYKDGFTKEPEIKEIELLISHNVDINKIYEDGKTPLTVAISLEHKTAAELLKKYGGKTSKELEEENK